MMIDACRFHNWARRLQRMGLKATGIVIDLKNKLLIVGGSVMGCFSKRRGMVTHLPARFHILVTAFRVRVLRPNRKYGRNRLIQAGSFAGSFPPATLLVLP
jgi:hypothetical protein